MEKLLVNIQYYCRDYLLRKVNHAWREDSGFKKMSQPSQQWNSGLDSYTQSCDPHSPASHETRDRKITEACWRLAWMKPKTWTVGSGRKPGSMAQHQTPDIFRFLSICTDKHICTLKCWNTTKTHAQIDRHISMSLK